VPKIDPETIESIPISLPDRQRQDRIAERVLAGRSVAQLAALKAASANCAPPGSAKPF
jgi:hypothetical protein